MATAVRRAVSRHRWLRILPVIVLIYVISYVDRTNISFAIPHIGKQFALSDSRQGFLEGVFFFGYLILQVPAGFIAMRWSARRWISVLIVLWGVCAVFASLSRNFPELVASRFLLGLAEGGVQPALMTTIRAWFPFDERSRAYSIFKLYAPISSLITAPTAGLILEYGTWRDLFLIQGGIPVIVGLVLWLWLVRDTPAKAHFLPEAERTYIEDAIAEEDARRKPVDKPRGAVRAAVTNPIVWLFTLAYLLTLLGMYGIQMWLPTLLGESFGSDADVGFAAMAPPIAGGIAVFLVGRSADRHGRHVAHVCWTLGIGAVVLIGASQLHASQRWLVLGAMVIATASSLAYYGPMWAMVSRLVPAAAIGTGIGVINGVGNLGGFFGPYIGGVLSDLTGSMALSQVFFAVALAGAGVVIFGLRKKMAAAIAAEATTEPKAEVR